MSAVPIDVLRKAPVPTLADMQPGQRFVLRRMSQYLFAVATSEGRELPPGRAEIPVVIVDHTEQAPAFMLGALFRLPPSTPVRRVIPQRTAQYSVEQ